MKLFNLLILTTAFSVAGVSATFANGTCKPSAKTGSEADSADQGSSSSSPVDGPKKDMRPTQD
jgi:hypothetical protein